MDRGNIDKIAQNHEDKLLLAKIWDKIATGVRRNIPGSSAFLSPRELQMSHFLFGHQQGLYEFGGYPEAERKMLIFLPEYLDSSYFDSEDTPIVCLRATFYEGNSPSHRDFLGALLGIGISRDSIGDICVGKGSCDFFVTDEIAPYILQSFNCAGRTKLRLSTIPVSEVKVPEPEIKEIRDTLSSIRLDSIISSGFSISRGLATQYISSGKASIDGLPCEKNDKYVSEGSKISVRGLGKIKLHQINGLTKKGRISVTIHRYM